MQNFTKLMYGKKNHTGKQYNAQRAKHLGLAKLNKNKSMAEASEKQLKDKILAKKWDEKLR